MNTRKVLFPTSDRLTVVEIQICQHKSETEIPHFCSFVIITGYLSLPKNQNLWEYKQTRFLKHFHFSRVQSLSATIHELSPGINTAIKTKYRCCFTHLYPLHHLGTVTFTLTHTPTGGWTEREKMMPLLKTEPQLYGLLAVTILCSEIFAVCPLYQYTLWEFWE